MADVGAGGARHDARRQPRHRAQGRPDLSRDDRRIPRRPRDPAAAPLQHQRPLRRQAPAAHPARPDRRGRRAHHAPTAPCTGRSIRRTSTRALSRPAAPAARSPWRSRLLHAYANPAHEDAVAARAARHLPGIPVTRSAAISPQYREYERTNTAVVNAYITPRFRAVPRRARDAASHERGFARALYLIQNNGGIATARQRRALSGALARFGSRGRRHPRGPRRTPHRRRRSHRLRHGRHDGEGVPRRERPAGEDGPARGRHDRHASRKRPAHQRAERRSRRDRRRGR